MKKRIYLLSIIVVMLIFLYFGPCHFSLNKCLWGNSIMIYRTLFHILLSLMSTSIFTFFISDNIFKKWLRFSLIWFIIDAIFVLLAPTVSPYFYGGPDKESVSVWMGVLFVIISIIMFIVLTYKEKKDHKK